MREKIAQEIVDYLREHPRGGDTLAGISKWWVMRQRISESVKTVSRVLEQLGKEGIVYERILADGKVVYFANTGPDSPEPFEKDKGGRT